MKTPTANSSGPQPGRWLPASLVLYSMLCGCGEEQRSDFIVRPHPAVEADDEAVGLEFPDGQFLDLGTGWEDGQVHCSFRIRNVSSASVQFRESISTSCGCTAGKLKSPVLLPGATTNLELVLTLPPVAGEEKHYVATVHRELHDGSLANIDFVVQVVTNAAWYTVPKSVQVRLNDGMEAAVRINVYGSPGRSARLTQVGTNIPDASISGGDGPLDPVLPVVVQLTIPGSAAEGEYRLIMESDDPLRRERIVPIRIVRVPEFDVRPRTAILRQTSNSGSLTGRLIVFSRVPEASILCTLPDGVQHTILETADSEDGERVTVLQLTYEQSTKALETDVGTIQLADTEGSVIGSVPVRVRISD